MVPNTLNFMMDVVSEIIVTDEVKNATTGLPILKDAITCTTIDLKLLNDRYDGYTKLQRLLLVAEKCENLQEDAYRLLLIELKKGSNTSLYTKLFTQVGVSLGFNEGLDNNWIEMTEKREMMRLERLESELMSAKTTMIKESIRIAYNDIGDLYYERGNLTEALKSYLRTRDYCSLPKHYSEMCVRVASVTLDLGQYKNVMNYINKAETGIGEELLHAKLKSITALVMLTDGYYKDAAKLFIDIECDSVSSGEGFSSIIAAEDIAIYGTLCCLAGGFDRVEQRKLLLENSNFKAFLEFTPELRIMIQNYFSGKYGDCLEYLESIKSQLLLDIYLQKHATALLTTIKERIILQYFSPYSVVDMHRMSSTLKVSVENLEKDLASLIRR